MIAYLAKAPAKEIDAAALRLLDATTPAEVFPALNGAAKTTR